MNIKKPPICAATLLTAALAFAPQLFGANVFFPPGTVSATQWQSDTGNITSENILSSNASGRWLVFDDDTTWTVAGINLRNTHLNDGDDSAIYVDAGTLNVTGDAYIGCNNDTRGTLFIRGGTLNVANILRLGGNANATGSLTIESGTLNAYEGSKYTQIASGIGSTATLSVQGGQANLWKLTVGDADAAWGYLNLSSTGQLSAGFVSVGNRTGSSGIVTIADSAVLNLGTGIVNIGGGSYSSAVMTVSGGAYTGGSLTVGNGTSSQGIVSIEGGATTVSGNIIVGRGDNAEGNLILSSGTVSAGGLTIGGGFSATGTAAAQGSIGHLTVSGGVMTISGTMDIAAKVVDADTQAYYDQSGGSVWAEEIYVGSNNADSLTNKAVVNITGGSLTSNTFFNVGASGANGNASAQVTIGGSGTLTADTITVMRDGTFSSTNINIGSELTPLGGEALAERIFHISGTNAYVSTNQVTISSGEFRMRGGTLLASELNAGVLGNIATAISISGGQASISSEINLAGKNSVDGQVLYNQSGGEIWAKQGTIGTKTIDGGTTSVTMNLTGGTLSFGNFLTMGANTTVGYSDVNVIVGQNAVLKAGRININGGATLDIAGQLLMQTPVSGSNNVALTATGSSGTANMIVRDGATVSIIGNLNLNANSSLTLEVGNSFNTIGIGGALNFSVTEGVLGTQKITLDFSGYTGDANEITLFSTGSAITGFDEWYATAEDNLIITGLGEGYAFDGLKLSDDSLSIIASITSNIPEPSACALLFGALALAAVARRRR